MAETLKDLRRRVRSVGNVQQITRAMEMVSAAKLRRAEAILMAGRPYAQKLQELLGRLASSEFAAQHPLFEKREGGRTTLVVFAADRGLCGAFNSNLLSAAEKYSKAHEGGRDNIDLYCVGSRSKAYFEKRGWTICGAMTDFGGNVDADRSNEISSEMRERFLSGEASRVDLLYSQFISTASFRPTVSRFLGLEPETLLEEAEGIESAGKEVDYIFEPSADDLFDSLLPRYLQSKMYITFAEQFTSEHSARMLAMHNATKNCEELGDSLTLKLNKARQAAITKELLDIVGGAEALTEA